MAAKQASDMEQLEYTQGPYFQLITNIKNKVLAEKLISYILINQDSSEPDWRTGDLCGYPASYPPRQDLDPNIFQQNELLEPVYKDIVKHGLHKVYENYTSIKEPATTTKNCKTVVIVGAGISGLAAAYELKKAGHCVTIVEMQARAGGRILTYGEKDGFAKYQTVDAGAMRLPNTVDTQPKTHYLTDYYISCFGLTSDLKPFNNDDINAYVKFYGMEPMRRKEWDTNKLHNFRETWPGWDDKIKDPDSTSDSNLYDIQCINDYYDNTLGIIKNLLTNKLKNATTNVQAAAIWETWVWNWSKFSLVGLLRANIEVIQHTLDSEYWEDINKTEDWDSDKLKKLLPWPEIAITAYSVFNYTEQLDQSLVQYLRDELAQWWSAEMHRIDGGMEQLPQAFVKNETYPLENDITYNFTVTEIQYGQNSVTVKGYNSTSGRPVSVDGNAVIVTVPLHGIRQIQFTSKTDNFPKEFYQAVEDIWYGPSTKIMIQSKTKFWAKMGPDNNPDSGSIHGGFTRTNLPIGQIHYPSLLPEDDTENSPGILLCYTWKAEALMFGSLHPQVAIHEAVRQIAQIHPKIEEQFEAGAIHAWYSDPAAQGAYALLKPNQFRSIHYLMMNPYKNIFFAGEGISLATGWIQGALESALRAAYQFYVRNEKGEI